MLEVNIIRELPAFEINVNFSCDCGEFLALVGPSGAGKTTLMRGVAGLERTDIGRIRFNDTVWLDTRKRINLATRKRRLGYVFQEYPLFPNLTVMGNVGFGAADGADVAEFLKFFDLWHLRDRRPCKLSGGERQRVALAQALSREPDVLLLDEPFSALDIVSRRRFRYELKKMIKEINLPVIHITHDLEEAEYLADTILPIVHGRINRSWIGTRARELQELRCPVLSGEKIVRLHKPAGPKGAEGAMQ